MDLLWSEKRALTRAEIIDLSPDKSWKPSAIHILLNSLLKKQTIQVEGFKPTGKNYGRTYAAAITPEQYFAQVLLGQLPKSGQPRKEALWRLLEIIVDDADEETLRELQRILDDKRGEGKGRLP